MKTDRALQGIASTIRVELDADGIPTNPTPDAATVTLTRASTGATLGPFDAYDDGAGKFAHTINPAEAATLDHLTARWSMTLAGHTHEFATLVEIVGGFLFTIAEAKAIQGMTTQTAATIAAYRTLVETELEDACHRAFVPRYARETLRGDGSPVLSLRRPEPRAVRSVTVDGTAYGSGDLEQLQLDRAGLLWSPRRRWPAGATITVGYEYGPDFPPAGAKKHALTLLKMWLGGLNRPIDDRAITFNAAEGGTYSLAVPGRNGSVFGQPDVDAWVARNDLKANVA